MTYIAKFCLFFSLCKYYRLQHKSQTGSSWDPQHCASDLGAEVDVRGVHFLSNYCELLGKKRSHPLRVFAKLSTSLLSMKFHCCDKIGDSPVMMRGTQATWKMAFLLAIYCISYCVLAYLPRSCYKLPTSFNSIFKMFWHHTMV